MAETDKGVALESTEEPVSALLEMLPDAFFALNHNWCLTYVNRSAEAMLGCQREELLGRSLWEAFPAAVGTLFEEQYRRAVREQILVEFVSFCTPLDRWVEVRANPAPEGLTIFFRDVSDRVRAEETQRRDREMLANLLQSFPNGAVNVFDHDLRYRFADGQGLTAVGLSPESLVGKRLSDLFEPEMVALVTPFYRRALAGEEVRFELPVFDKTYEIRAAPLHDPGGEIQAIIAVTQDISERRRIEAALRRSEERFRALTEHSSDVITVLALDGTILYESPSVAAVLGYQPEEMVGTSGLAPVHPGDVQKVVEILERLAHGGTHPDRITYRFRHKDGSWRWLESTGSNQIENPAIGGFVVNSRDVTERVRLEQQIIQSEKLASLGELVAGVAHEINNPLAAISGYAQLLAMHPDALISADAATIQEMVERINRIVYALRNFARPGGKSRKTACLNDVVRNALDVIGHTLHKADVEVATTLDPAMQPSLLNAGEIEQVLVNLLSNAEYALRGKPVGERRIQIRTALQQETASSPAPAQKWCVLTIADNGTGIPAEVRARIFDPFFTTKDIGEGTGLGLYISHGIIAAHGGSIVVESQEGEGATFTIRLPALPAKPKEAEATTTA